MKVTQIKLRISLSFLYLHHNRNITKIVFFMQRFWQMDNTFKSYHTVISSLFSKQVLKWSKNIVQHFGRWAHVLVRAVGSWAEAEWAPELSCLGASPWVVLGKESCPSPCASYCSSGLLDRCWVKRGQNRSISRHCWAKTAWNAEGGKSNAQELGSYCRQWN